MYNISYLHVFIALVVLSTSASGCVSEPVDVTAAESERRVPVRPVEDRQEGVASALGFLGFLNDPTTTEAVLKEEVGVSSRAAEALVAWRAGRDGRLSTRDDRAFGGVMEVVEVHGVGEATVALIMDYVMGAGWTPEPNDVVGVFDGVPFTASESIAALHAVNTLSAQELDAAAGLDVRALEAIVGARPLVSLDQLAGLSHVGPVALGRIRDLGLDLDCTSDAACATGWSCAGIPEGEGQVGKCRDERPRAGEGDACGIDGACTEGLVCTQEVEGLCVPAWMRGRAEAKVGVEVRGELRSEVVVYGLGAHREAVEVEVELDHGDKGDLRITLIDPEGQRIALWSRGEDSAFGGRFVIEAPAADKAANGRWVLEVVDEDGSEGGALRGWSLAVSSRW